VSEGDSGPSLKYPTMHKLHLVGADVVTPYPA
jgi:hypothetical protein